MTGPRLVGLTGGIGSGKSAVSGLFRDLGVPVIDSDEIARELTAPGGAAFDRVAALFGPEALDTGGELRRDYVRQRVFQNDVLRGKLEAVIHPLVYAEIGRRAARVEFPYCIVAIPLLVETGRSDLLDRVLVVDLPENLQVERAATRDGVEAAAIELIMKRQATRRQRLQAADDVIHNDGDTAALRKQVIALHGEYLHWARRDC